MTVLVSGGTGRLGRILVRSMTADGERMRVLTRDPAAADELRAQGIETVVGDLGDPKTVDRAVNGCSAVVAAASGFGPMGSSSPRNVDRDGNLTLIESARKAGAEHVVLLSMHGAAADARLELLRMKYAAEQALVASGVSWTIIRPAAFLETYLEVVAQPMQTRGATLVFGRGDNTVSFVSVLDVAAVIRSALREPALNGRIIEWGGLDLTMNALSDAIHGAAGRPGKTMHVPLPFLHVASVAARPFSRFAARVATAAVEMNARPAVFDSVPERSRHPEIAVTSLATAIATKWPGTHSFDKGLAG
jgi:uncharacterized protein YbjT (DUF2867 family)